MTREELIEHQREEIKALKAANLDLQIHFDTMKAELEGLLLEAYKYPLNHACETVDFTAQDLCERIDAALSDSKETK